MTKKLCISWLLALSIYPILSNCQEFLFDGFKHAQNNLTLNKVAHIESNGLLCLTNSTSKLVGQAFYSSPLRIKPTPSSPAYSFSTVFAFAAVQQYQELGGHGLTFTMASYKQINGALSDQYLGHLKSADDGGGLGYQVFSVGFDTLKDLELGDINDNHVGIDINSLNSSYSVAADLNLTSGQIVFAWIDYDSSKTRIHVGLSLSYHKPKRRILSFEVNLSLFVDEFVYVGFSASTGLLASSHYILGWSFNVNGEARLLQPSPPLSFPDPEVMKKRDKKSSSVMKTRHKKSPLVMKKRHKSSPKTRHVNQLKIVVVSANVLISLMLLFVLCLCLYKIKAKQACQEVVSDIIGDESLHMEFSMIRDATQKFSSDRKLGEGGFGQVYKGILENGQEIAVKRLSPNSGQGVAELKTEVRLIAKLQHRNLVKLLGFCISKKERILVYEFLPNSSLDKILFDPTKRRTLNWETRFKIISGTAKRLLYLHEDSRLKIVHRDLKWSNVLLDEAMNPIISDFGLAKLFGIDQTHDVTNTIVGTSGYMAPEYKIAGHYSIKSDVYSFGVMVLELVSGQRNCMNRPLYTEEALLHQAWRLWNQSTPLDLVDETLEDNYRREEVIKCIHIGLLCIHENATKRPCSATVVAALKGQAITLPLPSPPNFFGATDSTCIANVSVCETSDITDLYPR